MFSRGQGWLPRQVCLAAEVRLIVVSRLGFDASVISKRAELRDSLGCCMVRYFRRWGDTCASSKCVCLVLNGSFSSRVGSVAHSGRCVRHDVCSLSELFVAVGVVLLLLIILNTKKALKEYKAW